MIRVKLYHVYLRNYSKQSDTELVRSAISSMFIASLFANMYHLIYRDTKREVQIDSVTQREYVGVNSFFIFESLSGRLFRKLLFRKSQCRDTLRYCNGGEPSHDFNCTPDNA